MSIKTPLNYLRHRRDQSYAQKPTTHEKFATYSYINPQLNSTLFSKLPGEVRHLIYKFSLRGSPNLSRPYSKHTWYYRPGYTHARFININLLLTCRRIYLEADHLAISENEHVNYNPIKHGPPGHIPYLLNSPKYRRLLKRSQRQHIRRVHVFVPQLWLEDWNGQFHSYCKIWQHSNFGIGPNSDEHPERLKITIRHTDWWYFLIGENSPLTLDPKLYGRATTRSPLPDEAPFMEKSWGSRFKMLKGLKIFELELETLQEKKEELDEVVDHAFGWKLPLGDGNILVCDRNATVHTSWTGSKRFERFLEMTASQARSVRKKLQRRESDAGSVLSVSTPGETPAISRGGGVARIAMMRKKSNSAVLDYSSGQAEEEEELADEVKLEYYVVTLTFCAQPDEEKGNQVEDGEGEEAGEDSRDDPVVVRDEGEDNVSPPTQWLPQRSGFPTAYG